MSADTPKRITAEQLQGRLPCSQFEHELLGHIAALESELRSRDSELAQAREARDEILGLYESDSKALRELVASLRAQLAALTQERDSLKRDAERYRWLRALDPPGKPPVRGACVVLYTLDKLDAAIDAAMGAGNG